MPLPAVLWAQLAGGEYVRVDWTIIVKVEASYDDLTLWKSAGTELVEWGRIESPSGIQRIIDAVGAANWWSLTPEDEPGHLVFVDPDHVDAVSIIQEIDHDGDVAILSAGDAFIGKARAAAQVTRIKQVIGYE